MSSKYDLILSWASCFYLANKIKFSGAEFSGPALKIASKLSDNDSILLDFTKQVGPVVGDWEICSLSWGRVVSQDSYKVILEEAALRFHSLASAKIFVPGDSILIDTSLHEDVKHQYNFVYPAKIINTYKYPYFEEV